MDALTVRLEAEIEGEPAEDVEAATDPGDENVPRGFELVEKR